MEFGEKTKFRHGKNYVCPVLSHVYKTIWGLVTIKISWNSFFLEHTVGHCRPLVPTSHSILQSIQHTSCFCKSSPSHKIFISHIYVKICILSNLKCDNFCFICLLFHIFLNRQSSKGLLHKQITKCPKTLEIIYIYIYI